MALGKQCWARGATAMRILPARNGVAITPSAVTAAHAVFSLAATASLFHWLVALVISVRRVLPPRGKMVMALAVGVAYYAGAELAFWVGTLALASISTRPERSSWISQMLRQAETSRWTRSIERLLASPMSSAILSALFWATYGPFARMRTTPIPFDSAPSRRKTL
ncbi:MAG TPA: hypothetical protein VMA53_25890 [Stellaceae bacterium]|nr:hypothetical protein [Stellaceae bacterium]